MFAIIRWFLGIFLGLVLLNPIAYAEQPFDITFCGSGEVTMLTRSEELTIACVNAMGTTISNSENKIFDSSTWHGIGFMVVKDGKRSWYSYSKFMDPDGSLFFVESTMEGIKFLGGTGKWAGIFGGGKGWLITKGKPIAEGTIQNCRRVKGTFELKGKTSDK
jgi:hypothetical protein